MIVLTAKQEKFCQAYIETGNASEAYRVAYNADNMKPETVHKRSSELMSNGEVSGRVKALKEEHEERHKLTVDDLLAELEEARQKALTADTPQASAAVGATMGKAKLLGLDKQIIDHQSSDGSLKPITIELVAYDGSED